MRLRNTTKIPNSTVREVVRLVKPPGIGNIDVMVKNTSGRVPVGAAYLEGSPWHATPNLFVVARIPERTPHDQRTYFDRIEMLVWMLAHEFRHIWQTKHPKGWRVWGARGQFSENDCDAYATRKVRDWRRRQA